MSGESSADGVPLRSKHTSNFPFLLQQLGISLLVSTYQAGKLVLLRADGDKINTHFRDMPRPMGLAANRSLLAVGAAKEIRQYRNSAAVCNRLDPPDRHDACFLPRATHVTGDIDIHEMAWAAPMPEADGDCPPGEECLWFVNTRFSCLCTLDDMHSFVPRWRPPFISALAAEDRCHLNGMGLAPHSHGRNYVRFVTALAASDRPKGWRDHKRDGGIVMETSSGAIVASGLSMPHSPRLVDDRLWLLESGKGALGFLEPASGHFERVAQLPGFTRGLDFSGGFAFVGLSQVRESAVFSDIPVADRSLAERNCGVWVVDVRTSQTVAFLRFEDAVQEVFAVQVLPGMRYPEILPDDHPLVSSSIDVPIDVQQDLLQRSLRCSSVPAWEKHSSVLDQA